MKRGKWNRQSGKSSKIAKKYIGDLQEVKINFKNFFNFFAKTFGRN